MIGRPPPGTVFERGTDIRRNRQFGQRPAVHQHVDGFDRREHARFAGDAELRADGERRRAEATRVERQLEHLIVPGGALPLHGLLHELKVQVTRRELVEHAARAQVLVDADVHVFAVARVEHDLLRVALDVADAQVVAERGHFAPFTQSARVFHSASFCVAQCLPPG